jgi:hypothetical protein
MPRSWIEELLPDSGFWTKKGTTIFRQLRHLLEKWAVMCVLGSKYAGFGHPTSISEKPSYPVNYFTRAGQLIGVNSLLVYGLIFVSELLELPTLCHSITIDILPLL